jgi:Holliday junction resolvase RusA-like endonuclease
MGLRAVSLMFFCRVNGEPGAQGSKRFVGRAKNGRGIMVESSKKVAPWRSAVAAAAIAANEAVPMFFADAVRLTVTFIMPRKGEAKSWTRHHTRAPDLSKLVRSTEDALTTAAIWADDSRVVELLATKVTAEEGEPPGCVIIIEALPEKIRPERTRKAPAPKPPKAAKKAKTKPDGGLYFC